jgi:3-hydroxyisobutyrate dehydrogenase-like beta-hydroxyacid dehydrogenase
MTVVGLIAPGDMGAALGKVLTGNGVKVVTLLDGRSAETQARAKDAGMVGVDEETLVGSDFVLSVLPSSEALPLANRLRPALAAAKRKPVFVECNPLTPATLKEIEEIIASTNSPFVDGSIIGFKPRSDYPGPKIFVSGPEAHRVEVLGALGLRIQRLDAPVGAATALKLSYGAISKGIFAICSASILGATRAGAAAALFDELGKNQPGVMAFISHGITDMPSKTGRWVSEMQQIAGYLGDDRIESELYRTIARFYGYLSADFQGSQVETKQLAAFFAQGATKGA